MTDVIYIEKEVVNHSRVQTICARFPKATKVVCDRYTEVFNPKAQSFRLQKRRPALILARKHKNFVLSAPQEYGVGGTRNYYFSHMLNCIYDCRYCFLQGMYRSAHYVVFVNYEEFADSIVEKIDASQNVWFFSGYDCDSLAYEPVTGFAKYFLPVFENNPHAWLELRTKSTQIRCLLDRKPMDNVIVAFSFTPDEISVALEHKVPSVSKRIAAMHQLQERGWHIGLRFDPLIFEENYGEQYKKLFEQIFTAIDLQRLHSVTLGTFRLPKDYFQRAISLYPEEPLFAGPLQADNGIVSYNKTIEQDITSHCEQLVKKYIDQSLLYRHYTHA